MMTAEQLKNSIYQLAIQGKLVEQCDSDGNAVDLVYEIEKKKKSLLKNGKIKLFKGIEPIDEVPFDIPGSWAWVRLGSIVSIISDGTHRTPNYVENGVPFLSVQNISQGYFDMTKAKYITPDEHKELIKRCKPEKDDILVCRIGTLGKAIKVSVDFEFSIFVSLGLIRLIDTRLVDYVICVINSGYGKKWIDEVKVGGGTHTNKINLKSFPNFLIPLPPLNEQARILERLDEFKSLLSDYAVASTKLNTLNTTFPEMMKKSILQEAVQGKLVPQDPNDEPASVLLKNDQKKKQKNGRRKDIKKKEVEKIFRNDSGEFCEIREGIKYNIQNRIPFDIPQNWEWIHLGYVCDIARGGSPRPIKNYLTEDEDGINWIKIGDSDIGGKYINNTKERIIPEGMKKSRYVQAGDFLLTNSMSFGRPYILNCDGCIHDGWLVLTGYKDVYDKDFLYYMLSSGFAFKQFCDVVSGAVVKNLNSDKVAEAVFPVPPLAEQKRIVSKIEDLLPFVEELV